MKKRILIVALFLGFCFFASGQTFLWEAFDAGQMPPNGWTISGLPDQWSISNSTNAGGVAPEAKFTYVNQTTTTWFISPMMDLTGQTTITISFRHFYDDYSGSGPKVGVSTRSHNGNWNNVWEINPPGNVGPQQVDLIVTNSDVGQSEFQICFYLTGNMYNLDYWYLDNIMVFNALNLDAILLGLPGTPSHFGGPVPVKGSIMNVGLTQINSLEIVWQLDNGLTHSSTFTGLALDIQQTYDFTCTDLMDAQIGPHILGVWINLVNGVVDDYQGNDSANIPVYRVSNTVEKTPLFEEFTSSTCNPCANFNSGFVPWCQQHDSDITLVKYQMNWPGSGDPYYTQEGGARKDYYGVGFVPDLYCDGANVPTDMGAVQEAFDYAISRPGLMDIVASHTLNGHIINVQGAVLPFADFENCRLHIVVMEKITHNNATTNGETDFHHVMMKMIPDEYGTTVSFTDRQHYSFDETIDLTGTFVEEWDDLIVGIFVQNFSSKEVYQSVYSIENGTFNTEARLSDILMDGVSIQGFNPDIFSYDIPLPSGTSIIPGIEGIPIDPNATVIVVPAYTLPGTTTIDVFAEDLTTHNRYSVNFMWFVGVDEKPVSTLTVYPNPAHGIITILGAGHARVTIMSASGNIIETIPDMTSPTLDLGNIPGGVYILKVERTDGMVIQKKIVVL